MVRYDIHCVIEEQARSPDLAAEQIANRIDLPDGAQLTVYTGKRKLRRVYRVIHGGRKLRRYVRRIDG